jgi:iron(III) transport system ATP-binding protein
MRAHPLQINADGISKRFDATTVLHDVALTVAAGSTVSLLGPSGCGKTTLLRILAGLERPDAGEVRIGDAVVASERAWVPPEERGVGMVFQDWALFPHLTVARNVSYGLPRAERRGRRVGDALEMVGLAGMGDRLPSTLSGGQQQRVALARSLAPEPAVLLLDEPFSNLDSALKVQVRSEVHRLLSELAVTAVFVTHDQEEAFMLGDEVAVMHRGRIVQQAPPAVLYARPATPWVATFVGEANLLDAHASGGVATTPLGTVPLAETSRTGAVVVLLRPEEVRVAPGDDGEVEVLEYYGHDTVYVVRLDGGTTVRARAGSVPVHRRGDRVTVQYAGPPAIAFPAGDEGTGPAPTDGREPDPVMFG